MIATMNNLSDQITLLTCALPVTKVLAYSKDETTEARTAHSALLYLHIVAPRQESESSEDACGNHVWLSSHCPAPRLSSLDHTHIRQL